MKRIIRDIITDTLYRFRVTAPNFSNHGLCTIITFHRIFPENLRQQYPLPGLVTTPEELHWILKYCKQNYNCGSISDTIKKWKRKDKGIKPLMAVTFDDGQEDNYKYAVPVLENLGIKGTFFVPVSNIEKALPLWHDILGFTVLRLFEDGKTGLAELNEFFKLDFSSDLTPIEAARCVIKEAKLLNEQQRIELIEYFWDSIRCPEWAGMMTWSQLKEMKKSGHEIGSHTMTHPILSKCADSKLHTEISESRKVLQTQLDAPVESFCYPNGDFDERVLKITQTAGYTCAVTTELKANYLGDDILQLGRCDINPARIKNRSGKLSKSRFEWRLSAFKRYLERR